MSALRHKSNTSIKVNAIEPGKTRIGWIGTGVMGRWMCQHLMEGGYPATVYNRTSLKLKPLLAMGATAASTPREVAENSDVVFSMVGFPKDVEEVLLGDKGAIAGMKKGGIIVDMTTSKPSLAKKIWDIADERGVHAVDAPVSGGDVGARTKQLTVMTGGRSEVVDALRPLFKLFARQVTHFGLAGTGQHVKMMNQTLIASNMIGVVEGLLYGQRAGLDLKEALNILKLGAGGSWSLENYGPRIIDRNFDPGFLVEHFIKDMSIALREAQEMGLALPGLALAHQLYIAVQNQGHGRKGTHSLMLALETINGIQDQETKKSRPITPL